MKIINTVILGLFLSIATLFGQTNQIVNPTTPPTTNGVKTIAFTIPAPDTNAVGLSVTMKLVKVGSNQVLIATVNYQPPQQDSKFITSSTGLVYVEGRNMNEDIAKQLKALFYDVLATWKRDMGF